ncbi:hypothetical protein TD95_004707 [Thielaviopsis punctulata]|uniref:Actin-related protein 4 n=1 Tax=Thielaviopsis punctulata TaxID=72032 RepID=A0A0F4ZKX9_9PEZI|nr:hypothetical protein TD95_004707 [Thielaviopsis punctulata]
MAYQQPLTSANAPTDVYGGDEVSAIVLDPGYSHTRAGFAGEDVPKSVIPSFYAHYTSEPVHSNYGDEFLLPRENLEVRNYMSRDGIVEDWDTAGKLWENMLLSRLQPSTRVFSSSSITSKQTVDKGKEKEPASEENPAAADGDGDVAMGDSTAEDAAAAAAATAEALEAAAETAELSEKPLSENPLLLTEAAWNTPKAREKAMEIIMESWGCPAFWFSKTPVLAAFTAGKATALVIDVGASGTSVVAVHDGMVLKRSISRSPVGGLWISNQVRSMLAASGSSDSRIDLTPSFLVESKTAVDAGAPAQYKPRKYAFEIAPSFRAFEEERLLTEFKESVVEVWREPTGLNAPGTEDMLRSLPGRVFEMPTGANQMWREQRYKVTEGLWNETAAYEVPGEEPLTKAQTIPELVRAAINSVDPDLRSNLLANVVVTGGSTLINGFADRLSAELAALYPGVRVRLNAAGLSSERRFGAWVGGSILASLGTFHQMWVSKKEYEENGAVVVEKRCK